MLAVIAIIVTIGELQIYVFRGSHLKLINGKRFPRVTRDFRRGRGVLGDRSFDAFILKQVKNNWPGNILISTHLKPRGSGSEVPLGMEGVGVGEA